MTNFIVKRFLTSILVISILVEIVFLLQFISHTNPAHIILGPSASKAAIYQEEVKLGLTKPLVVQMYIYILHLMHGNLGISYQSGEPITLDLIRYLPATIELASTSMIVAVLLGFLFGISSTKQGIIGKIGRLILVVFASVPGYLIAYLGLIFFYGYLHILPAAGEVSSRASYHTGFVVIDNLMVGDWFGVKSGLQHLILPILSIALVPAVSIGRVFKSSLEHAMRQDYVRTARAKGLSENRILIMHVTRNAIGPALTMTGLQAGLMFSGIAVIEDIFAWPGVGFWTAQSIPNSNYPAIAGVTLVLGIGYVLINMLVDIGQSIADPRVRL